LKTNTGRLVHETTCTGPSAPAAAILECTKGCGRTLKSNTGRLLHETTCSGVPAPPPVARVPRVTSCPKCASVFGRSDSLKRHILDCGIEHKCSKGCGETFISSRKRARHVEECRYVPRKYFCPICPYTGFRHLKHYDQHAKTHDPAPAPQSTMLRPPAVHSVSHLLEGQSDSL